MGRITEYFGAVKYGVTEDTRPYFTSLDIDDKKVRGIIKRARRHHRKHKGQEMLF